MTQEQTLKMIDTFFLEGFGSNFFSSERENTLIKIYLNKKPFISLGYENADLVLPKDFTGYSAIEYIWKILFEKFFDSYESFVKVQTLKILKSPFPYFPYTEEDLYTDFESLKKSTSFKANSGRQIINCFHKSLFKANKKGCLSPFLAWQNEDLVKAIIKNRLVYSRSLDNYSILRGFSTSGKAPRVSVFAPSLTRYLIQKYLSDYEEIIDPFSGYSGRMLGAASLGKSYRGWDINPVTVKESKELLDFLKLENCSVEVKDSVDFKSSGQCLLACPPYGDLENWNQPIDNYSEEFWVHTCLENYNCQRYLFVVSGNYNSERCVEILSNKNHLNSKSSEKVLLFDKGSF